MSHNYTKDLTELDPGTVGSLVLACRDHFADYLYDPENPSTGCLQLRILIKLPGAVTAIERYFGFPAPAAEDEANLRMNYRDRYYDRSYLNRDHIPVEIKIFRAARYGYLDDVITIFGYRPPKNTTWVIQQAYIGAGIGGHHQITEYILEHLSQEDLEFPELAIATGRGEVEKLRQFLSHSTPPTVKILYLIHIAIMEDQVETLKLLRDLPVNHITFLDDSYHYFCRSGFDIWTRLGKRPDSFHFHQMVTYSIWCGSVKVFTYLSSWLLLPQLFELLEIMSKYGKAHMVPILAPLLSIMPGATRIGYRGLSTDVIVAIVRLGLENLDIENLFWSPVDQPKIFDAILATYPRWRVVQMVSKNYFLNPNGGRPLQLKELTSMLKTIPKVKELIDEDNVLTILKNSCNARCDVCWAGTMLSELAEIYADSVNISISIKYITGRYDQMYQIMRENPLKCFKLAGFSIDTILDMLDSLVEHGDYPTICQFMFLGSIQENAEYVRKGIQIGISQPMPELGHLVIFNTVFNKAARSGNLELVHKVVLDAKQHIRDIYLDRTDQTINPYTRSMLISLGYLDDDAAGSSFWTAKAGISPREACEAEDEELQQWGERRI